VSEEASSGNSWWREALAFWPLGLALLATGAFGWYTLNLAQEIVTVQDITTSRYQHFLAGRPNEMGDALAGFVGSLTLIWVVASVLQQSMELRAQRREFSEMVRAQDAQVSALNAQAAIFQDEKQRRDQLEASRVLEEMLKDCLALINRFRNVSWREPHELDTNSDLHGRIMSLRSAAFPDGKLDEHSFHGMAKSLEAHHQKLKAFVLEGTLKEKPERPEEIKLAGLSLLEISAFYNLLDRPTQIRVNRWNAGELAEVLLALYHDNFLWKPSSPEDTA
jgi:hypothetical protein